MPTHEQAIVSEARRVARLQSRARELRRLLKENQGELRAAKKNLRALAAAARDPFEQAPPLRMFGEKSGS